MCGLPINETSNGCKVKLAHQSNVQHANDPLPVMYAT